MTEVRYIIRHLDNLSGRYLYSAFDYKNDALEFMELIRKKGMVAHLFIKEAA